MFEYQCGVYTYRTTVRETSGGVLCSFWTAVAASPERRAWTKCWTKGPPSPSPRRRVNSSPEAQGLSRFSLTAQRCTYGKWRGERGTVESKNGVGEQGKVEGGRKITFDCGCAGFYGQRYECVYGYSTEYYFSRAPASDATESETSGPSQGRR